MLKMTGLAKVYRTEMVETYALRDFNLNVREGEFVGEGRGCIGIGCLVVVRCRLEWGHFRFP